MIKMPRPRFVELLIEVKRLGDTGHAIRAIKLLREKTNCGLKDAFHAVRRLQETKMELIK